MVNNLDGIEVLYATISSSAILWEVEQRNRFRPLSNKYMEECETAYQDWILKNRFEGYITTTNFQIDFCNGLFRRKSSDKKEERIRRANQQGFWLQYRQSPHQLQVHIKMYHLQVDNQVFFIIFYTTFSYPLAFFLLLLLRYHHHEQLQRIAVGVE